MASTLFSKTVKSLSSPRLLALFVFSVCITLVSLIGMIAISIWILSSTAWVSWSWLEWLLDIVGTLGVGVLTWFLFPIIVPVIGNLFLEKIASIVEADSYQVHQAKQRYSWLQELWFGIRFLLLSLLLNLLCLPFYFIPGINLILYYGLNGYLLGREFFESVAKRQLPKNSVKRARKKILSVVWGLGILLVFMANVPVLNLTVPFVACVVMVHLLYQKVMPSTAVPSESINA